MKGTVPTIEVSDHSQPFHPSVACQSTRGVVRTSFGLSERNPAASVWWGWGALEDRVGSQEDHFIFLEIGSHVSGASLEFAMLLRIPGTSDPPTPPPQCWDRRRAPPRVSSYLV